MSLFTDRRPLRQIGGLRAYLVQVSWSLRWRLRRRPAPTAGARLAHPPPAARRGRSGDAPSATPDRRGWGDDRRDPERR